MPRELSSLVGLQHRMSAALRGSAECESEATRVVRPPGALTPAEALGIYRNMMRVRFAQTMADAYPAVQKAVGVDEFGRLERTLIGQFGQLVYGMLELREFAEPRTSVLAREVEGEAIAQSCQRKATRRERPKIAALEPTGLPRCT